MFWTSKVFHPVWMPLETRQRNSGAHVMGQQSKSECTLIKELITAAWSDLTTPELYLYGDFNLAYVCCVAEKGGSILPATACCCSSSSFLSLVLTLPFYQFSYSSAGSVPWSGSQLGHRAAALARDRQQEKRPSGGHRASSDLCWILWPCNHTEEFSTALFHPFVKVETGVENRS